MIASKNAPQAKGKGNNAKAGSKKSGSGNTSFPTSASTNAKARHKGKDGNSKVQLKEVKAKENAEEIPDALGPLELYVDRRFGRTFIALYGPAGA